MTVVPHGCLRLLHDVRLPKEYALASRYTSEAELKWRKCQTQETECKKSSPQGSDKCLFKNVSQGREMLQSVKCLLHKYKDLKGGSLCTHLKSYDQRHMCLIPTLGVADP